MISRKEIVTASTHLYNYKKQLGETITFDDGFVDGAEWMQAQKQSEIDELNNQLSVLTEQLDAIHVFCEVVKEHYIKKARKWLENEYFHGKLRKIDGSWFVFEDDFIKAMKGELDAIAMEAIAPSLTDYVDTDAY